eukprot:TRINITY_DN9890_c0_g1_i3.p2 TRINITY_DN9890_c0_g1~~TRINITY_DN9890_c0_g1_i3.p2  ORF type:complete len:117 (-),score=9.94 TRINITY_DN9890_c0_g1_i3:96-446(-)
MLLPIPCIPYHLLDHDLATKNLSVLVVRMHTLTPDSKAINQDSVCLGGKNAFSQPCNLTTCLAKPATNILSEEGSCPTMHTLPPVSTANTQDSECLGGKNALPSNCIQMLVSWRHV